MGPKKTSKKIIGSLDHTSRSTGATLFFWTALALCCLCWQITRPRLQFFLALLFFTFAASLLYLLLQFAYHLAWHN